MPFSCSYLPKNFLEKFSWMNFEEVESTLLYERGHMYSNFNVINILKIISTISENTLICFSALHVKSRLKFKRSFLNYLNFLLDLRFVKKSKRKGMGSPVYYSLTKKGILFLEMFR